MYGFSVHSVAQFVALYRWDGHVDWPSAVIAVVAVATGRGLMRISGLCRVLTVLHALHLMFLAPIAVAFTVRDPIVAKIQSVIVISLGLLLVGLLSLPSSRRAFAQSNSAA